MMSPFSHTAVSQNRESSIQNLPFDEKLILFHFHLIHIDVLFSVSSDGRLSAVSAAAATPQKPIQVQFPDQIWSDFSSGCETSNRRILCSFMYFKNIYEFQLPVATGGQ